jgi:hypothetical protein
LAVDLGAVAPDQFGELEWEGVFDARRVGALRAGAFDALAVEKYFGERR